MTKEQKDELIMTVLERTGIELDDKPELNPVWDIIEDRQEEFDLIFDTLIKHTVKYLTPENEIFEWPKEEDDA